ncbi:Acetyltransferase, ribosomal protein N-acetylase [Frankia canadensis]|uniref:Acetyltransferase, ribosomal protein N-acetylase n=1 Tax=Frankia canadensis TaxID=1836972 RepID=A0A2I2KYA2_9ACTN|nr:phosphopantetheine-binding protein [Frankia canadensis]SNQ50638.1 Acetyltransferase, ribosomal protein N-acetylase [Frankia canadensis]SOU57928.1 Acetyltransferase, ribosomal protein N-acetylase [Frankia canadensis]
MLQHDEFEQLVARRLGFPDASVTAGSRLHEDLGLDSFRLLDLCLYMTELGADISEANWLDVATVGELYGHYRAGSTAAGAGSAAVPGPPGQGPAVGAARADGGAQPAQSPPAQSPPAPRFAGRFLRLLPVLPASTPFLYELAVTPEVGFRWRYRGSVPSYPQFEQELWQGVLTQFLIESIDAGRPIGHAICYNPEFSLGYAYVGAAVRTEYAGSGLAVEALDLFVRYIFDIWPFRKLYFEVPEFNYPQFAGADRANSADGSLILEGRLRRHDFYRGRYWDRLILAVYRDAAGDDI